MIAGKNLYYLDIYLMLKKVPIRRNIRKEKYISNIIITSILRKI
jgi:hypothetical protein